MSRFPHLIFRLLVVFVGAVILLGLLLVWRLNASPVTSTLLTPYIESGIEHLVPGTHAEIAHTILTWNNTDHTAALHADGVHIIDKNNAVIAEIPAFDVELNMIGVLFGRFLPVALVVDHPQIKLERSKDGVFSFGGMAAASGNADNAKDSLAQAAHDFAHAHITRRLDIRNAALDVHDATSNSAWSVHIPEVTLARTFGDLAGRIKVEVHQKNDISTLELSYTYDRRKSLHVLATHFADITPSFFAGGHPETLGLQPATIFSLPLTGEIKAAFTDNLSLESGSLQIHGAEGTLIYPDFWTVPRAVKNVDIKAAYDRKAHMFDISAASIDFGGPKLGLSLSSRPPTLDTHDLDFDLSVHLDNWPLDQFDQLWPKPVITDARDWMAAHLSAGKFDHGEAVFKGALSWNDLANIDITDGKGKVSASNARIDYLDGMPQVSGVSAIGDFDLRQMQVQITSGGIGAIRLQPFVIAITGLDSTTQVIDIPLKVSGPIPDVLRLIDAPRLGYASAVGLSPDAVTGKIEGVVALRFPLLKDLAMKDVEVKASADLTDLASSKLVKGVDIAQGSLALELGKEGFSLAGPAMLNKLPLQISWRQNFKEEPGTVLKEAKLTGTIDGTQAKDLGIDALDGTHGPIGVFFQFTQPSANTTLYFGTLEMGAAEIHIDQLGWKKPAGVPATLKFTAEQPTGKNINIKSIDLSGDQLKVKGDAVLAADDNRLLKLNLQPLQIGRTNATLHFTQADTEKGDLRFEVEGPALDISGLRGGKEPAHTDPRPKEYHIRVGKLYTSATGFMTSAQGYAIRDGQGWNAIKLHGLADGGHALDIALTPQGERRIFSITCDDFGKALKGMGFTDTVRDGKLDIRGKSTAADPRVIEGEAKIGSFTVKNLPVLALLLNAASPFGFAGILTDSADFSHLTGKFRWQGDMIELKDVRAAGAAVGMNIDGKVDMNSGAANLNGTIVPFSVINRVLNNIPLIGDLITGGEGGGVLAVAYSIGGTLGDPKISVNPVSLLTPGFLRNLFFGTDSEDTNDDADETPEEKSGQ